MSRLQKGDLCVAVRFGGQRLGRIKEVARGEDTSGYWVQFSERAGDIYPGNQIYPAIMTLAGPCAAVFVP